MIGALIARISLEMTRRLVAASMIAKTLTIIGATNATPIVITTSAAHGFPIGRAIHGIISGVGGNAAANGAWILTPTSATTLSLGTYDAQGGAVASVGDGTYTSGGQIDVAFPDGQILLGRRNIAMQTAVATPRIVFVPIGSPAWTLDPYGGVIPPIAQLPRRLSDETDEQQTMKRQRQLATEQHRFEVHITGCASPPDPDFGDFDVTQSLYHTLYAVLFDLVSAPRALVLGGSWESQREDIQLLDVRGQKWVGQLEIMQPVTDSALDFLPVNTTVDMTINLSAGTTGDETTIQFEVTS